MFLFAGVGFGMSYSGVIVSVSEHFHKHFALANGISMTGASIGMVIMPVVFRFLIDMYSWRGAIMIVSAIQFHVVVCSMVLKKPPKRKQRPTKETIQMASSSGEKGYSPLPGDVNMNTSNIACSSTSQAQPMMKDCKPSTTEHHGGEDIEVASQGRCCQRISSFLNHTGVSLFWTNRVFTLLMLIVVGNSPSFGITLPYLAAQAKLMGISEVNASLLISILGFSSILTRLTHGRLVDAHVIQPAYIYSVFLALTAIGAPIIAATGSYSGFVICSVLIGLSSGGYIPLQIVMIRMIVGKDRFPGAFGIGLVVVAVGNMSSAYLGGKSPTHTP